jgi:hypothetical protein
VLLSTFKITASNVLQRRKLHSTFRESRSNGGEVEAGERAEIDRKVISKACFLLFRKVSMGKSVPGQDWKHLFYKHWF